MVREIEKMRNGEKAQTEREETSLHCHGNQVPNAIISNATPPNCNSQSYSILVPIS